MEREKLESAAADYFGLRGLFMVPTGILIILSGLCNLAWGPFGHTWIFPAAIPPAAVGYLLIDRHYRQRYGRATMSTRAWVKAGVGTVVGAATIVGGTQTDWSAGLPFSATAVAFALVLMGCYAFTVGVRVHHAVIWGGLMVAGLLPVWNHAGPDLKINVGLLLVGGATLVTGFFDHTTLTRSFGPFETWTGDGDAGA
jgi:hypothetical protein